MKKIITLALALALTAQSTLAIEWDNIKTREQWIEYQNALATEKYDYETVIDWVKDLNANTKVRKHTTSENSRLIYKEAPFEDAKGHWAFDSIDDMYNKGIVTGKTETIFDPDSGVTRAEFATMIMRAEKIKFAKQSDISDVANEAWYMPYLAGAKNEGIIPAEMIVDNTLNPDAPIRREEMAAMAVLAYEYKSTNKSEESAGNFSDASEISEAYKTYVNKANSVGIVEGADGKFNPQETVTRAEAATVINRISEKIDEYIRNYKSEKSINLQMITVAHKQTDSIAWDLPPATLRATEAVLPGESVQLYGEGFTKDTEIKIAKVTEGEIPQTAPENAIACTATLYDPEGQFITFTMPEDAENGAYYVWASNKNGASETTAVNNARIQWLQEEEAAKGQKIKVIGRNLDGKEFGAQTKTKVALSNGEKTYECIVTQTTPFATEFIVPYDIPTGEYEVYVSNDGILWCISEDDIKFTIIDEVNDPIDLGMSWANQFNWDNILNVMDYGAKCDGTADDGAAIQKALDEAAAQGGGLVYLPNNTYYLMTELKMPARTVIAGESREGTIINYTGIPDLAGKNVIGCKDEGSTEGRVGIFRLTFLGDVYSEKETVEEPDILMWLGHDWGGYADDMRLRKADYYFVKDVDFKQPWQKGTGRAYGVVTVMRNHLLMEGCNFTGYVNTLSDTRNSYYIKVCDNDFINPWGVLGINGGYCLYENNWKENVTRELTIKFMYKGAMPKGRQGFFVSGPAYIEGNTVKGTGTRASSDDGETICCENFPDSVDMVGNIKDTDGTTVYLEPMYDSTGNIWGGREGTLYDYGKDKWSVGNAVSGDFLIVITGGRGIGQMRKVTGLDEKTKSCTISKPWDIEPDKSSTFQIAVLSGLNFTVYNNETYDGGKGIWVYRGAYDAAVVDNLSDGTTGVTVKSALTGYSGLMTNDFSFHSRIDNNMIIGGSCYPYDETLCGYDTLYHSGPLIGYLVYGGTLRRNTMKNNDIKPGLFGGSDCEADGTISISQYYQYFPVPIEATKSTKGLVFEGNHSENNNYGYKVGDSGKRPNENHISGVIVRNNTIKNVKNPYNFAGVNNFVFIPEEDENETLPFYE